jgi:hypothetical protein
MSEENVPLTNKQFAAKNDLFTKCCELSNTPNTARQASKFRMGIGKAFGFKNQVKSDIQTES